MNDELVGVVGMTIGGSDKSAVEQPPGPESKTPGPCMIAHAGAVVVVSSGVGGTVVAGTVESTAVALSTATERASYIVS